MNIFRVAGQSFNVLGCAGWISGPILKPMENNLCSIETASKKYRTQIKYYRNQLRALRLKMTKRLNQTEVLDLVLLERYQGINKKLRAIRFIYAQLVYRKNML